MKNLTPTSGPHSHGIAARARSTCRTDAHAIASPTGEVGGLCRQSRARQRGARPRRPPRGAARDIDRHRRRCGRAARSPPQRRPPPSRRRSLARADDDRRPSVTSGGAGDAVASRPGGGARRRRGHRPRPVRGRARRRGARRDRLALPPDHRRPRAGRLRRHQPTDRLRGARYAWAVVVTAAGLSGLAQAVYLASGATLDATPTLRFGIGAWPALAAAVAAHLLYLLAAHDSAEPRTPCEPEVADRPLHAGVGAHVQQVPSNRPAVQPPLPDALDATGRPSPAPASRPTVPSTDPEALSTRTDVSPARARARAAALRHATRHGALPTVSALAAAADVSRGTAATVLKPLRSHPVPPISSTPNQPDLLRRELIKEHQRR